MTFCYLNLNCQNTTSKVEQRMVGVVGFVLPSFRSSVLNYISEDVHTSEDSSVINDIIILVGTELF